MLYSATSVLWSVQSALHDVGASVKAEIIRDMLSVIEKCRLDDRRSAGFDHSQAYDLMYELCST